MSSSEVARRLEVRLAELEKHGQRRDLCLIPEINLCSNDYLGLAADARLKAAVAEGIERCSKMGSTGSRLLSGHDPVWDSLEGDFAAFAGTEASLFFNSGFAANTGLFPALLGAGDVVFSDALNHASIIDGLRLSRAQRVIYPHCDVDALEDHLRHHAHRGGAKVIVTESIFSMGGDRAPLAEIFAVARRYRAGVVVDEAHATAVCGPNGRGVTVEHGLEKEALAIVHTCGKALASLGAFVCGSEALKQLLINCARTFIFSTAPPPYMAFQVQAALRLARKMDWERQRLAALSASLRERLRAAGWDCGLSDSHIVPLIAGSNEGALRLAAALEQRGFGVRAVRAPAVPPGAERLRISLTASLTAGDLDRFTAAVAASSEAGITHV